MHTFSSAGTDSMAFNGAITFAPLDREACTIVKIPDGIQPDEFPDNFVVNFTNDMDVSIPPRIIPVTDTDAGTYTNM